MRTTLTAAAADIDLVILRLVVGVGGVVVVVGRDFVVREVTGAMVVVPGGCGAESAIATTTVSLGSTEFFLVAPLGLALSSPRLALVPPLIPPLIWVVEWGCCCRCNFGCC